MKLKSYTRIGAGTRTNKINNTVQHSNEAGLALVEAKGEREKGVDCIGCDNKGHIMRRKKIFF